MSESMILPTMGLLIAIVITAKIFQNDPNREIFVLAAVAIYGIAMIVAYELTESDGKESDMKDNEFKGTVFECKTCGWMECARYKEKPMNNAEVECPVCGHTQSTRESTDEEFRKYDVGLWWFIERDMRKAHQVNWNKTHEYKQRMSTEEFVNNGRREYEEEINAR